MLEEDSMKTALAPDDIITAVTNLQPASPTTGEHTSTMLSRPSHQPSETSSVASFVNLPPELRCMIWNHALPDPQIITITSKFLGQKQSISRYKFIIHNLRALYKVPSIFHACSEARSIALATYKPSFGQRLKPPIYFNIDQDALFMLDGFTLALFYHIGSRLVGETEDIKDSVPHMMLASGSKVPWRVVNCLYQFNFATLGLETCKKEDFTVQMPNGLERVPQCTLSSILLQNYRKHIHQRSLPTIEYLTTQQMFDISDFGQPHKSYEKQRNIEFENFVRTYLPHLDASTLHFLKTRMYPPIFNGMKIMEKMGYYTQEERFKRFVNDLNEEDFLEQLESQVRAFMDEYVTEQ